MVTALHLLALGCYAWAWGLEVRAFRAAEPSGGAPATRPVVAGAALHLAGLLAIAATYGALPLIGLGPASSTLAFVTVLLALGAERGYGIRAVGLFLLPLVCLLLAEAAWVGLVPAAHQTAFRGPWFVIHVSAAFLGYAGLFLGSVAAVAYVLQFRALKRKQFGSVFRFFPSLDHLDRLNRLGLGVGFSALTVGLVAGWSWSLTYGPGFDFGNPQVILGSVTWTAFLAALAARVPLGWRGRRAAEVTALAFGVTLAAYFILRLLAGDSRFFL